MKNFKQEFQILLTLYKKKNFYEAELLCKKLVNLYSENILLYNILGLTLHQQNKNDDAILWYEKGLKLDPKFSMIYNNMGSVFRSMENHEKAETYFKKSISLDSKLPEAFNNLGNLYKSLNKYEESFECYKKAIEINPNFFAFHYNLAIAYKSTGRFDESKKYLKSCLKLNKNFFTAHRNLSYLIKYKNENDEHLIYLKSIYQDKKIDKKFKKDIAFSLGKAHEDIKDFKNSFKYFNEGNDIYRSQIKFSIENEKIEFKSIKKVFNKKLFKQFNSTKKNIYSPIFILGMPRSGTTLVEQIISSHPNVFGGDELNFIPDIVKKHLTNENLNLQLDKINKFEEKKIKYLGDKYIDQIIKISNSSERVTDKMPINFKWIGLIKIIIPNAKIIHCTRNSKDTCFSIFKNFFTSNELDFAYNIDETVEFYNLYGDMMVYWKNIFPDFIYDIKYESLIENLDNEVKRLLKICDLEWNESCLKFYNNKRPILTASDAQARKPLYNTSINSWKKFEQKLEKPFLKLKFNLD